MYRSIHIQIDYDPAKYLQVLKMIILAPYGTVTDDKKAGGMKSLKEFIVMPDGKIYVAGQPIKFVILYPETKEESDYILKMCERYRLTAVYSEDKWIEGELNEKIISRGKRETDS